MTRISIENLIQLLAMVGIIGSLILVGLEMRQSQRIAIAGQQMEKTAIMTNEVQIFIEAGLDYTTPASRNRSQCNISAICVAASRNHLQHSLYLFENDYFQFSQGLMTEDVWRAKLGYLRFLYDQCDNRQVIETRNSFFSQGLIELIESLPDNCAN